MGEFFSFMGESRALMSESGTFMGEFKMHNLFKKEQYFFRLDLLFKKLFIVKYYIKV